jgi:hypothetical protein
MARRVLEGTGVKDIGANGDGGGAKGSNAAHKRSNKGNGLGGATTSWSTKYRKLMRLVHPDALVSLKPSEPTTALALAMSAALLRTYAAASTIMERQNETVDEDRERGPPPSLATPGDFPPGGPPR